jgi:hypothetical protein
MSGFARAVILAVALLPAACGRDVRRADFPSFVARAPFPTLRGAELPEVELDGDATPTGARRVSRGAIPVSLGGGFVAPFPCEGGWRWAADSDFFVAVHASTAATQGLEVVFVIEHSEGMGRAALAAVKSAAATLVRGLPAGSHVGFISFAEGADGLLPLNSNARTDTALAFVGGLTAAAGSSLAAGLNAAADLFGTRPGIQRRVLVLTSASTDTRNASRAAGALASRGVRVDLVSVGGAGDLEGVASAGSGALHVGHDAATLAAQGQCSVLASDGSGAVDAWLIAQPIRSPIDASSRTLAQLHFLATVDPTLASITSLSRVADRLLTRYVVPHWASAHLAGRAVQSPVGDGTPDGGSQGARLSPTLSLLTPTLGGGIAHRSVPETWTGWRWIGENRHHTRIRLSRAEGSHAPSDMRELSSRFSSDMLRRFGIHLPAPVAAVTQVAGMRVGDVSSGLAPGTPTTLFLGYLGDGIRDETGLGVAMVCVSANCEVASTFATILAEVRPHDGHPRPDSAVARVVSLARAAGFEYLPHSVSGPPSAGSSAPPVIEPSSQREGASPGSSAPASGNGPLGSMRAAPVGDPAPVATPLQRGPSVSAPPRGPVAAPVGIARPRAPQLRPQPAVPPRGVAPRVRGVSPSP